MTKYHKFLKLAKKLAEKTMDVRRQFGAVIADGHRIYSVGRNRRSHPGIPKLVEDDKKYWGLHAEIDALLKCDFSVRGMDVYIHGQNRCSGRAVYSTPCSLCRTMLRERGIARAIFTTKNGGIEVMDLRR